jgi:hypothetical protein
MRREHTKASHTVRITLSLHTKMLECEKYVPCANVPVIQITSSTTTNVKPSSYRSPRIVRAAAKACDVMGMDDEPATLVRTVREGQSAAGGAEAKIVLTDQGVV